MKTGIRFLLWCAVACAAIGCQRVAKADTPTVEPVQAGPSVASRITANLNSLPLGGADMQTRFKAVAGAFRIDGISTGGEVLSDTESVLEVNLSETASRELTGDHAQQLAQLAQSKLGPGSDVNIFTSGYRSVGKVTGNHAELSKTESTPVAKNVPQQPTTSADLSIAPPIGEGGISPAAGEEHERRRRGTKDELGPYRTGGGDLNRAGGEVIELGPDGKPSKKN